MMKGADRFIAYTLLCSAQCWAVALMESGDTVMKKPALYTSFAFSITAQLSGCFTWSTCSMARHFKHARVSTKAAYQLCLSGWRSMLRSAG